MALNFPTNPNNGDTYTEASTTWQYDGVAWNVALGAGVAFPNTFGTVVADGTSLAATTSSDSFRIEAGTNITISSNPTTRTLTINGADTVTPEEAGFYIAADDSTQRFVVSGETVQFVGGTGITTSTDTEGNVTINSSTSGTFSGLTEAINASLSIDSTYENAIATYRMDNVGTSAYTIPSHYSGNNPAIYVITGTTVAFDLSLIPGHPFELQDNTLTALTSNLVHVAPDGAVSTNSAAQGKDSGTLYWRIPETATGTYVYQCQSHAGMFGTITLRRLSSL